ncbi:MAG: PepSY domain-containing protein [Minicystis sp.]
MTGGQVSLRMLGVPGRFVDLGLSCLAKIDGRGRPALQEKEAIRRAVDTVAQSRAGSIAGTKSVLQYGGYGDANRLQYLVTVVTETPPDRWWVHVDAMTGQILFADRASRPRH